VRGQKMALLVLPKVRLMGRGKTKCAICAVAEFQNILCGGEKNKTRSVWLSCRKKVRC